jgi:predicted transcriptional regulator
MLRTYPEQLIELAGARGIELKDAFEKAGIPSSTYYRSLKGARRMTFETASRVADAISQLGNG